MQDEKENRLNLLKNFCLQTLITNEAFALVNHSEANTTLKTFCHNDQEEIEMHEQMYALRERYTGNRLHQEIIADY